jgi:putative two-component system response regulator
VGEAIPLAARIVAVADVYDALVHERPYKKAWSHSQAVAEISSQTGQQFDPQVVEAFLTLMSDQACPLAA